MPASTIPHKNVLPAELQPYIPVLRQYQNNKCPIKQFTILHIDKPALKKIKLYILFIAVLLLNVCQAQAQVQKPKNKSWYDDKLLHFGFMLGANTMDFNITPSQEFFALDSLSPNITRLLPGINIQIITDLRLNEYMNLRFLPGVSFGQRNIMYYIKRGNTYSVYNEKQKIESSYLEFPLTLKFKGTRLNNVRPYLIGGLNYRVDLSAKKEFVDERPVYIRLKRSDLYYEAGAGFDFYLTWFKLGIDIKMSNGLFNVLVDEPAPGHPEFRNAIDKIKSQIWVLSFHFE